jgi:hypothetical protein
MQFKSIRECEANCFVLKIVIEPHPPPPFFFFEQVKHTEESPDKKKLSSKYKPLQPANDNFETTEKRIRH